MKVRLNSFVIKAFLFGLCLSSEQVLAQNYTWNNVVIMGGGFISGIEVSPAQQGLIYARTDVGGAYRWNDSTSTWTPLTDMFPMSQGNYLGIESLAPDPQNANNVYAAAGMYLTGNGNGVILSSTNQGSSWTINTIGVPMGGNATGRGMGERLAVDPNLDSILFFGSPNNGLWKSTNSAASWTQVTAFPSNGDANYGLSLVIFDGQGGTSGTASTTIFVGVAAAAGTGTNLYESTNGGTSWAEVTGGPTGLFPRHASLGSDGNLWVAFGNDYGPYNVRNVTLAGQIWKYNVAAKTWTNVTPAANWSGNAGNVSVDAENAQHAIISTLDNYAPDKVLATTNGGTSWTVIANPDAGYGGPWSVYNVNGAQYLYFGGTSVGTGPTNWVDALALDPFNSNRAMHGSGEGLFVSTNIEATGAPAAITWTFDDSGLEETVPLWMPSAVNFSATYGFLSAVGDVSGTRNTSLTAPSASGMYNNPVFGNCNSLDFAESNPNDFVRVGNSSTTTSDVAYSTNNGQAWTPWGSAPPGYGTSNEMESVAVAAGGSTVVVSPYSGYGNPAYATSFGGAWTACSGLPAGAIVASDRSNSATFYGTSGGTLYESTNGGKTFASVNTFTGKGAPRPCFGEPGEVWVAANGGALYRFTNGGSTKTQITNVTVAYGVGFGMGASGQTHPAVFVIGTVGGQYGFYRCDDGVGTTWTRINDNNHQFGWLQGDYIGGDENTYGRCYLTTGGRGVIYGSLVTGVTSTPTGTPTATRTNTPASTPTFTPTATRTNSPTNTATSTASRTPTFTATNTVANTATFTVTSSSTATKTNTPTSSQTSSPTSSATSSPSATPTKTASSTATNTVANTVTTTPSATPSTSPTATRTNSATTTSTVTRTNSPTSTSSATATNTETSTNTVTPTATSAATSTATVTSTNTMANTSTSTVTLTTTRTATGTATHTATGTVTNSPTVTNTNTLANTPTTTATTTATHSATSTDTSTATSTTTNTATPSATTTSTNTATHTTTATSSDSPTFTGTPTMTPTGTVLTATPTSTATSTDTAANTATTTKTVTSTNTSTTTNTATKTTTYTPTNTLANTATQTATSTPTSTLVNTATPIDTATSTNTLADTATNTATETATATVTKTNSPTITGTPTLTSTTGIIITPTASFTATNTGTNTSTPTLVNTATNTPSQTATSTPTSTLMNTVTNTATATASDTATKTTTLTPTNTFADTTTQTATSTSTNTSTATASNTTTKTTTATPIDTLTNTDTQTATATSTASNTATPTNTSTNTLTKTTTPIPTATSTNTLVSTETPTATPAGNKGVVIYPNPVTGSAVNVLPPAYSDVANVQVEIFTIAFRLVQNETFYNIQGGTPVRVELTDKKGIALADGIYYLVVTVNGHRSIGKLLILH